jgi:hypothetical protein
MSRLKTSALFLSTFLLFIGTLGSLTKARADVIDSSAFALHPTLQASFQPALQASPTPSPTPEPLLPPTIGKAGVDNKGNCTSDYLQAYAEAASEINTLKAYVKSNEAPPNMIESILSCSKIQSAYKAVVCNIPSLQKQAKSVDFEETCTAVREVFKEITGKDAPVEFPALQNVTDASPLALIKATAISIRVSDSVKLQKAVSKPGVMFVISGSVYDLHSSLSIESDVRCSFVADAGAGAVALQNGQTLQVSQIQETFSNGYRETLLAMDQPKLGIDCVSKTGSGLKLGELKAAFGSLLQVNLTK